MYKRVTSEMHSKNQPIQGQVKGNIEKAEQKSYDQITEPKMKAWCKRYK